MDVSKNRGVYPPKWMVKIMENPMKMDDLGVPLFLETPILNGLVMAFEEFYFFTTSKCLEKAASMDETNPW